MDAARFLGDLTVALTAAVVAGFVARRLGLNTIVGYLVAGIAIGPFTPGYVAQHQTLANLADLGLIFLLFSLGLGLSFSEILAVGWAPLTASIAVMALLGCGLAIGAGLLGIAHPWTVALICIVSSTAIGAALLKQWGIAEGTSGAFVLALLIVQDLVSAALIVAVSLPPNQLSMGGILVPLLKAIGFVAIALVLGATWIHRLVLRLLSGAPTEVLFPSFAALALLAAWLSQFAGLSFEFGAFVAGMVISEAAGSRMVESIVAPFRHAFEALFFVAIGTLFDVRAVAGLWVPILAIGLGFVIARQVGWAAVSRIAGFSWVRSALLGLAMVSLGEFNIVLTDAASTANRIDNTERNLVLGITFLSIIVANFVAPLAGRLRARPAMSMPRLDPALKRREAEVAIVGFGRVGKTVADALRRAGISFVVLEPDRKLVAEAASTGIDAIAGSGEDPLALEAIVSPRTRLVLAATPSTAVNAAIAARANALGKAVVVARAARAGDESLLMERGASHAFVPEVEGALSFARVVLRELGQQQQT